MGDERGLAMVSSGARPRLAEGLPLRAGAREGPDLEQDKGGVEQGKSGILRALLALLAPFEAAVDFGLR